MKINQLLERQKQLIIFLKYSEKEDNIVSILEELEQIDLQLKQKEMLCQ